MSTPFLGEMKIISWNFAPQGWAFCNGQTLPINQNQALFSLLGTQYGGDGQTTFRLPDMRGQVPVHQGSGFEVGQRGGENAHTMTQSEMPTHNHALNANTTTAATANTALAPAGGSLGQTIGAPATGAAYPVSLYSTNIASLAAHNPGTGSAVGGNQPHENRQPFLTLNMIIALQGIFPSRN